MLMTSPIHIYTCMKGHAIGIGDPDSLSPKTQDVSLLCAVTFLPVPIRPWMNVVSSHDCIETATRVIMNVYGGIILLVPSDIHLSEGARHPMDALTGVH